MWICPACQSPLTLIASQWRCARNHSYDRAREGYVNLLLANQKSSADPGDNKQMINARRQFLEQGHFAPLALKLAEIIRQQSQTDALSLYDAGCGEGYYLQQIAEFLRERGSSVTAAGSDVSRSAIQKAAKKYAANNFAVASSFSLPLASSSQNVLLQIFAPASNEEVHRVLYQGGLWLQVTPGALHLFELKQALYPSPEQHSSNASVPSGFTLVQNQSLKFKIVLPVMQSREQLLMMTPYYWTAVQDALPAVLESMGELTADFTIRVLQKN